MLTIAIPTFNRIEILNRNLRLLLPQMTDKCRLLVLDNCSPTPVDEGLRALLSEFPDVNCEIVRNRHNIGGNANILRSMETCQTPYLWILGDDDPVMPNAVARVFEAIEAHPDCFYFNFSFNGFRRETFVTSGLEELIHGMDDSANVMWISSALLRIEDLRPNLKLGYQFAYSMLPHVVMLLSSVGESGKCCFSRHSIIHMKEAAKTTSIQHHWSRVNFAVAMPTIKDLPLPSELRPILFNKLYSYRWAAGIDLRYVTRQLLLEYLKYGDHASMMYYFDQICARGYSQNVSPRVRLKTRVFRLFLLWPRLTALLFWLLTRRKLDREPLQDRHARL